DQGQLRLTISKIGRETDFLLPSVQEQMDAQQTRQQAAPMRFRSGEPYFAVRGFIQDRTGEPLSQRLRVGSTSLVSKSGERQPAVHVTYSSLRNEPSLNRIYEPPAQTAGAQQPRSSQPWASNAFNLRNYVNTEPTTPDAFLPPDLLNFAAFFRPLSAEAKQIDFHHIALETQVQESDDIRFEDLTTTSPPVEKLAAGYRVALEGVRHQLAEHTLVISFDREPHRKTHELLVTLRVALARPGGTLPSSLRFTPPLVEDDMGDRAVCRRAGGPRGRPLPAEMAKKAAGSESEKRELWYASMIDPDAKRFTITTRLAVAAPPTRREFLIRDIPLP
ncbi:MAG: hypothetical protein PVH68_19270, partial [Armatimonadota bacterium]